MNKLYTYCLVPFVVLMMLAISPLLIGVYIYEAVITSGMTPDEKKRYLARF